MKVFHVSWNDPETYFMKYSERKISQRIFPLRTPILKNISESLFMKIFTSGNSQILLSFQTLS